MPFGPLERPALGLSLLKARLVHDGIACEVRYPLLAFADLIGTDQYQWISSAIPYVAFAGDWSFCEALYGPRPETDARYIAEVLRGTWHLTARDIARVKTVRALAKPFLDHCMATLRWNDYALVGFTSTFEQNLASLALAQRIRAAHPRIAIVFGGANWEGEMGEELHRQFPFVDYACTGEADESFPALASRLLVGPITGADLPRGVVHRDSGVSRSTGRPAPVQDMDALPLPDFSDYFREWSESGAALAVAPTLLVETSRGCWWGQRRPCTFCGLNGSTLSYRSKSGARALAEMKSLSDRWGTDRLEVTDNVLDMRHFADLLPSLAADGRPWQIFLEVRATLSRGQVASLHAAGAARIQPGIESLSDHVLQLMRKGTSALRNVQLLKWCREYGLGVDWNLLYGFPGETREDYEEILAMLPAIEFLDPPGACAPIRLDRFSPYFEKPRDFGLVHLRPIGAYGFLYPFPRESLERIAYHFDFDYRPGEAPTGYADGVMEFTEAWRRGTDRGLLSSELRPDGSLLLRDTRRCAVRPEVVLSGTEAKVYEFCDECRSLAAILRHLREQPAGSAITETGVRAFLDSLTAHRLMLADRCHWLSLAVRDCQDPRAPGGPRIHPESGGSHGFTAPIPGGP